MMFTMASSFTAAFFLPIYFQSVKGATPLMSGVYTLPTVLGQLVFSVLSGLISRFTTMLCTLHGLNTKLTLPTMILVP